ncbi:MAG: hypothetical protein K8R56_09870, partial [Candidatus Eisenbacteria bacterium]|nr:hypothetical protein [Candidatus Eisenbacteria bacterium]
FARQLQSWEDGVWRSLGIEPGLGRIAGALVALAYLVFRLAKEDSIDPRVGLVLRVPRGAKLGAGDVFAELHLAADSSALVERAVGCFTFADTAPEKLPDDLVLERV